MSARLLSVEEVAALLDMSSRRVVDTYEQTGRLTAHRVYGKQGIKHGYSAIEVAEVLKIEPWLLDTPLLDSLRQVAYLHHLARSQEVAWAQLLQEQTRAAAVREQLIERDRELSHKELALDTRAGELGAQLSETVDALNHATQRADACEDMIARQNAQWSMRLQAAEECSGELYLSRQAAYKEIRRERLRADRYEVALATVAIGALAAAVLWWLP